MPRILIVDDYELFVTETIEHLRRRGWTAEGVFDGDEAVRTLTDRKFDAVLLDRAMPGRSGDDVLRWIRSRPELQDLCVIMLTGYADVGSAVDSLKLGAFQYLLKPVELPQLRSMLAAGIAWHRAHAMRRDLLVAMDSQAVFAQVRSILIEALQPDQVHIMFLAKDGLLDAASVPMRIGSPPRFVSRILAGEQVVFEDEPAAVAALNPMLAGARTLMAVPVPGPRGAVVGVLDMESLIENAFDPSWAEVLRYLADLTGLGLEIESQAQHVLALEASVAKERLEQLELLYREFRHSIATHVQVISMQARELLDANVAMLTGDQRAAIEQRVRFIVNNANVVETVVQDLRALYAALPQLNRQPTELGALLRECARSLQPAAGASDIEILAPTASLHMALDVDPAALNYAVTCLMNNAIEAIKDRRVDGTFTTDGRDAITLALTQDVSSVQISVRDTGIGFDEPERSMLFKPLYTTKVRTAQTTGQEDVKGLERLERVLETLARLAGEQADAQALGQLHKGVDILIRDGEQLSMFVRQGPTPSDVTLGEFEHRVLDRISTTRPLGGEWPNRGIGLYSAQRIAVQHGGYIRPASPGIGMGATFTITLPRESAG